MGVSIEYRRSKLAELYGNRFVNSKNDREVAAIYNSCLCRGYFKTKRKEREPEGYHQMTLFELGLGR